MSMAFPVSLKEQLKQPEPESLAIMKPASKARPSTQAATEAVQPPLPTDEPSEAIVREQNFLNALASFDTTEAADHGEFVSSLTVSIAADDVPALHELSADNLEAVDKLQGRYVKVGEQCNGSSCFRQVQAPGSSVGGAKLLLCYFTGQD